MSDHENSRSCGGLCCKRFTLPYVYEDLREIYRREMEKEGEGRIRELRLVFPLLIPLGEHPTHPNGDPTEGGRFLSLYTCKALDHGTGLCTIYETRPEMCRDYPYGRECQMHECPYNPIMRRVVWTRPLWRKYRWVKDAIVNRINVWRLWGWPWGSRLTKLKEIEESMKAREVVPAPKEMEKP